jgi:hypothetical protein
MFGYVRLRWVGLCSVMFGSVSVGSLTFLWLGCVRLGYVGLCWSLFKVHLARGSGSNMGPPFKVLIARCSDPYMWSLFSNCTS